MPMNEYKIGDAIMVNGAINFDKKDNLTESKHVISIINDPNNEKIINNLKFFFEYNRNRKGLLRKYFKIWKECVENLIKRDKEIEKLEQKYKNESVNIFEDINNEENCDNSIFNDNSFQVGAQRKELCVKKEITNSKVNKEIKKTFRIGTVNNNVIIKFENNENGNDNNKVMEKSEDNGGINSINDDKKENDKNDKNKTEKEKTNKNKNSDKVEKSEKKKKKKEVKTKKRKLKPKKNINDELKRIFEKINNSKLLKNAFIKWFLNSRIYNNISLNDNKNISDTLTKDSYSERSTINITNRNNKYNSSENSSKKIKLNKSKNEKDKQLRKEEKSHKRKKVNNIVEDYNSTGYDNGSKRFQINKNKENIINNALVPKNFKKNDILNQNKSYSPTLLQKYDQDEEYSISISNKDYSNDNYTSRKKSYVIEEEPVQVRQRRYTNGESPQVQEHTIRMVRLTEPIKEIKDVENGNLEIRFAGEIYEIGTEITTYPTEITETITETTRIISEDTGNENKIYNETEEEITFQGKTYKRITKTVEEDPNISHSSISTKKLGDSKSNINAPTPKIGETQRTITSYIKKIGEPKRINTNFNSGLKRLGNDEINKNFNNYNNSNYNNFNNNKFRNDNYTNNNSFNNSYKNNEWNVNLRKYKSQNIFNQNEIINLNDIKVKEKEKENDKTIKTEIGKSSKELQNGIDIIDLTNKNNFGVNEFSNNNINYSQKVLPKNKIYTTLNEQTRESEKEYSSKTYKNPDLEHRSSLQSIHSNKSDNISANELNADSNVKENKKLKDKDKDKDKSSEDNIDKKTKKLIKKYKKALNLLKKVIKSRKKRNKSNFEPKVKLQYYFNLFVSKSFPNGLDAYRQNKILEKNKKENKIILDVKDINSNSINNKNIINKSPYKNKIKAKMTRIIDIIRTHRRKSRKLKIKLKEKNNLEKLYICFNLWHKNVFDAEDDKNNDEEEFGETISSMNGNDYFNDKNKKNMNRNSATSINSINSVKSNNSNTNTNNNNKSQKMNHNKNINKINKNKEKSKIKKVKNNDKIISILKKFVLKKEKTIKNFYFKKWQENSLIEIELSIPYSKPKSVHLNEIQIPRQKIIKNNKSCGKLIDLKQVKKDKIIDINTNIIENGKKVNNENKIENNNNNKSNNNIITINTNVDVSSRKNRSKKIEEANFLNTEDRKELNKEEESDGEEGKEDIGEETKQKNNNKNNINNNELNGNIYTRMSNNEKKPQFNNRNIKIKKDENINIKNDQNIKPENNSIDIKDKLIKLLKKINDKTNLYFYFIKWHNIILFKATPNESKEEETVIVTPRRVISKIVKNFSPVKENNNSDKNNNLLRILRQKEQEILNDNNTNESLAFLKRNKTRIFVKNELSENKIRSKTLLTHQKIGNMSINRRQSNNNEFDDEESYSERYKTIKPIKHYSNMNINSPKKRRILLKKKENKNISDEEESSNKNILEKENNKKNLIKTHIGNIIVKSKKIDDNQSENKNRDEVINTNVTEKNDTENKIINSSKNSSKKIIMTIKKNNNQKSEKKKIKKVKNKNLEKDIKKENEKEKEKENEKEKEKEKAIIQNICDLSENNTNIINENINIIKNNKNINLLSNNDIKEKYITLLKKHNYELDAYRIFYLYSLFNDNKDFYRLKYAFKKWKKI